MAGVLIDLTESEDRQSLIEEQDQEYNEAVRQDTKRQRVVDNNGILDDDYNNNSIVTTSSSNNNNKNSKIILIDVKYEYSKITIPFRISDSIRELMRFIHTQIEYTSKLKRVFFSISIPMTKISIEEDETQTFEALGIVENSCFIVQLI